MVCNPLILLVPLCPVQVVPVSRNPLKTLDRERASVCLMYYVHRPRPPLGRRPGFGRANGGIDEGPNRKDISIGDLETSTVTTRRGGADNLWRASPLTVCLRFFYILSNQNLEGDP